MTSELLGFLLHSQSGLEASVFVTAPTVATFSLVMVQEIAVPDATLSFLFFSEENENLRQMAHLLPHRHLSTTAVVLASPACWCCNNVSKRKGQKLYGNLVHCLCTAQDVLVHFVAVILYESSRWMSPKTNSLPLQ